MSSNNKEGFEINESIDKVEHYVQDNKKSLTIIIGAAVLIVLAYFAYTNFILAPQEEKAQNAMFAAERYFGQDSIKQSLNGDGTYPGFEQIAQDYGSTKSGNLANYYLGMTYLKKGDFEKAIETLKKYDAEDDITGALALGGIGAANQELGRYDEAISYYKKAADYDENNFTRPLFLFKSGRAYEQQKNYAAALEVYNQIKKDFPTCTEARDIDKYIGRATALSSK
ncbi:MAG: YfgM family protein [Bacteroidota bacterium]